MKKLNLVILCLAPILHLWCGEAEAQSVRAEMRWVEVQVALSPTGKAQVK